MEVGETDWWPSLIFPPINLWSVPRMDIKKTHMYSIEHLYHFKCAECSKWWTIGDFHTIDSDDDRIFCPHCGTLSEINNINEFM